MRAEGQIDTRHHHNRFAHAAQDLTCDLALTLGGVGGTEIQGNRAIEIFPSPFGRRCSAGVDEGTAKAAKAGKICMNMISLPIFPLFAALAVPSPQPLSRRERGF